MALRKRTPVRESEPTVPLAEHAAVANQLELVTESLAGLEQLAREDAGWRRLTQQADTEFTRTGLIAIHGICTVANIKSPLIGRGLRIRRNYVWGQGVEINAREVTEDGAGEVNDLIQGFMDSPEFVRTLGSAQAREERETDLGTRGEFFIAAITTEQGVRPRLIPQAQIVDYVANPDDATDVWFYKRQWTINRVSLDTGARETITTTEWHPVLDYRPTGRERRDRIGADVVRWDAPIQHCAVNTSTDGPWGLPDAYAALDWARAYADFLTQWAILMRALSRYAWRTTAPGAKAAKVKQALANGTGTDPMSGQPVGGTAVMSSEATLEAIPKSGATIDSGSGKPLAGMTAAALDVPVTMLLADPGTTGARAVAETLDRPLELTTGSRQNLWSDWLRALLSYVIADAVERGQLSGVLEQDGTRQRVVLADEQAATIEVTWPPIAEQDPAARMEAIKTADDTGLLPPKLLVRLMLDALGVEDPDEVLDDMTDDNGEFVDPRITAAVAMVQRERDGAPGSQAEEAYR